MLHNDHTCQTCKIIEVNIELAILAFILLALGHANFNCQHEQVYKNLTPRTKPSRGIDGKIEGFSLPPWLRKAMNPRYLRHATNGDRGYTCGCISRCNRK